jgi:hypothetical protein
MSHEASFTTSPPRRSRGNRNDSPASKQEKEKEVDLNSSYESRLQSIIDEKMGSKSDTSFFHNDDDDNSRSDGGKKKPDTISERSEDDE